MKHLFRVGLAGFFSVFFIIPVLADPDIPHTIIITASRNTETVDDTLAPVSVITRQDIERTQASTLSEALRGIPGVMLTNSGGPGQLTSVFMRGSESDHVLVLIDGVKVGSVSNGMAPFQNIPLDQIEKIEVVRGPRSSLYGSEAIGGVIQLFTYQRQAGFYPMASIGIGSHQTYSYKAGLSGGNKKSWYNFRISGEDSAGINACRGQRVPKPSGCFTFEPDKDGYRNTSVTLRGGVQPSDRLSLEGYMLNSNNDLMYDGSTTNQKTALVRTLGSKLKLKLNDYFSFKVQLGQSTDDSNYLYQDKTVSKFDSQINNATVQSEINYATHHRLITGVDFQQKKIASTVDFDVKKQNNTGVFAQHQSKLGPASLQASLRYDKNQHFGGENTGGLSLGYPLGKHTYMTMSYANAYKVPTFNELYYPAYGNPDLQPETASSVDLGFKGNMGSGRWAVNMFDNQISNLIAYDPTLSGSANIDKARTYGIEFSNTLTLKEWHMGVNLVLLEPKNKEKGNNYGKQLARRAKRELRFDLDHSFDKYTAGLTVFNRGSSFSDFNNNQHLGGFTVVDLRTRYRITKDWSIAAKVNNIFDHKYETVAFYNQDGINFLLTLDYRPIK